MRWRRNPLHLQVWRLATERPSNLPQLTASEMQAQIQARLLAQSPLPLMTPLNVLWTQLVKKANTGVGSSARCYSIRNTFYTPAIGHANIYTFYNQH